MCSVYLLRYMLKLQCVLFLMFKNTNVVPKPVAHDLYVMCGMVFIYALSPYPLSGFGPWSLYMPHL